MWFEKRIEVQGDDAQAAMIALMLLANQVKDRDPDWSQRLRRVAHSLIPGRTLKLLNSSRTNATADQKIEKAQALMKGTDIIG